MIDTTTLVSSVQHFTGFITVGFQMLLISGCLALAGWTLVLATRLFRAGSLAEKERRAEQMQRELHRARMQPRYTPPTNDRAAFRSRGNWRA